MSTLERAIALAARAHEGQTDKAGAPYILHPLRVLLAQTTDPARMVAALHDVVEDCGITLDDLRAEGSAEEVVQGVAAVTRLGEGSVAGPDTILQDGDVVHTMVSGDSIERFDRHLATGPVKGGH